MPGAQADPNSNAGPIRIPPPSLSPTGNITLVVAQSPRYYPHVERHLRSLAKVFAQVRLLYWEKDAAEPLYASPGVVCERLVLPFGSGGTRFFLRLMGGFYARLVKLAPANIEAIDPYALAPARAYAVRSRWLGKPKRPVRLAYFSMEYFSELPSLRSKPWKRFAWRRLERWGAAGVSAAATVCDGIAVHLSQDFRMSVITVRNVPWRTPDAAEAYWKQAGKDRSGSETGLHVRCGVPNTTAIAIYQGMLQTGRGLETALRAMPSVPALHFAIIGAGPLLEPLRALAEAGGCADRVHFLGEVDFRALMALTRDAFVGLAPFQPLSPSYLYSLPGKLFEYIQADVPVIATSLPEILKVVEGYGVGICLDEYTPETLAAALRRLLEDGALYQSFRANLTRAKAELCWEAEEAAYLSLYGV